jgi:hypothetical protein
MIFSIDRNYVVYVKTNGADIVIESAIKRNDFLDKFNNVDLNNIVSMNIDYDRNVFHVNSINNELIVLDNPSQHPLVKFFDDNKDSLANWFITEENKKRMPSKYHTYDNVNHVWIISTENKINLDKDDVRFKRDQLLIASDWTQLSDVTNINKETWALYRQTLRDITSQNGFPYNITFPTKPN